MNKRKLIRKKCKIIFFKSDLEISNLWDTFFQFYNADFSEFMRKNSTNRNNSNYHFELTKLKREVERIETHRHCLIDDLVSKKK